jgi:hypothetical protein
MGRSSSRLPFETWIGFGGAALLAGTSGLAVTCGAVAGVSYSSICLGAGTASTALQGVLPVDDCAGGGVDGSCVVNIASTAVATVSLGVGGAASRLASRGEQLAVPVDTTALNGSLWAFGLGAPGVGGAMD